MRVRACGRTCRHSRDDGGREVFLRSVRPKQLGCVVSLEGSNWKCAASKDLCLELWRIFVNWIRNEQRRRLCKEKVLHLQPWPLSAGSHESCQIIEYESTLQQLQSNAYCTHTFHLPIVSLFFHLFLRIWSKTLFVTAILDFFSYFLPIFPLL